MQVSTSNLERVRRIKNRLVRLTTRVQTLREMLEKLMDDDSDMHAMHLTARAYDQLERQVSFLSSLHIHQACPLRHTCHAPVIGGPCMQPIAVHRSLHDQ